MNFVGTLSATIIAAAYAIADDFSTSRVLVVSMVCGALGSLFALAALSFDHDQGGRCFVRLSLLCVAAGTICMVAATQAWEVTFLTAACIATTAGLVWQFKRCSIQCRGDGG